MRINTSAQIHRILYMFMFCILNVSDDRKQGYRLKKEAMNILLTK